jgi:hypothetical protein
MSSLAQRRKCPARRHGPSTVTAAALTRVLSVATIPSHLQAAPPLTTQAPIPFISVSICCPTAFWAVASWTLIGPWPSPPRQSQIPQCTSPELLWRPAVGSAERRPRTQLLHPNRPRTRGRAASESPEHRSRRGDSSYDPGPRLRADGRRPLRRRRLTLRGSLCRSWSFLCSGILTSNPPPAPVLPPRIVCTRP